MHDVNPEWDSREKAQKSGFLRLLRLFAAIWIVSYPAKYYAAFDERRFAGSTNLICCALRILKCPPSS
jgi:hypothetical protein